MHDDINDRKEQYRSLNPDTQSYDYGLGADLEPEGIVPATTLLPLRIIGDMLPRQFGQQAHTWAYVLAKIRVWQGLHGLQAQLVITDKANPHLEVQTFQISTDSEGLRIWCEAFGIRPDDLCWTVSERSAEEMGWQERERLRLQQME